MQADLALRLAKVEDGDRLAATGQRLGPDLDRPFGVDAVALPAKRVLVYRDHVLVHQDCGRIGRHLR